MNENNLRTLNDFLKESLTKGWIKLSQSLARVVVLFIKKKGDLPRKALRLYIDYRRLNNSTVKNRYPILRADNLRDRLSKVKIFISIDLR